MLGRNNIRVFNSRHPRFYLLTIPARPHTISARDIVNKNLRTQSVKVPTRRPEEFLPLTPAMFHILLALADKERHGYHIMREVDERTEGNVKLGPGTLYGSIKRMMGDGLIEELEERPDPELDDERRRYYRLTDFGFRVATAEAQRLEQMVRSARAKKLLPRTKSG